MFEPDRGDERLFFQNVFRYADRRRLAEHAYQRTRGDLLRHADGLQPLLRRHGIELRLDVLEDPRRTFLQAIQERKRREYPVTGALHRTLDALEAGLAGRRA